MRIYLNKRAVAAAVLAGTMAGWGGGCASSGGNAVESKTLSAAQGAESRGFYADWYDPAAVVLPPPPAPATTTVKR